MKKIFLLTVFLISQTAAFSQYINYQFYEDFLKKYVSVEGYVDYDAIYDNQTDLKNVIQRFESLKTYPNWRTNPELSHWINIYNVYSI